MQLRPVLAVAPLAVLLSGAASRDPEIPFEKFTLPNGLEVLVSEDHRLPLVAVNTWYHVGAGDEVPGRSGFAHLFEHVMFQGSKHVAEDTYFKYLEGAGASDVNGTTDFDRTNYYEVVPKNQLELALWLESDRMGWLLDTLSAERLENQRAVVRKERQQSTENVPYGIAQERMFQLLFPAPHPYNGVVIGSHADLEAATLDDVRSFFTTWYVPNNATLVVVGDVETAEVKKLVEKYYGEIAAGPEPTRAPPATKPIAGEQREALTDEVELPAVFIAWLAPPVFGEGDADLDLAASLMGQGVTSKLYEKLVYEDRIAQDVSAWHYGLTQGSVFGVEVYGKPGSDPADLEAAAWEVIDEMIATPPTDPELARTRRGYEAGVLRSLQSLGDKADTLNYYNHHKGDPSWLAQDLQRYRDATPASVQQAIAKTLVRDARVVITVTPKGAN